MFSVQAFSGALLAGGRQQRGQLVDLGDAVPLDHVAPAARASSTSSGS